MSLVWSDYHYIYDFMHIDTAPPLIFGITASGRPFEGQTYSLTCDLMGDESLDVADVDNRFRWDRLTPTFHSAITRNSTLSFNPLTTADEGQYECTNNIVSQYLTGSITHTQTFTVTVSGNV